jgi:perosamine synthetase
MDRLAIDGGKPIRDKLLPYGHQCIDKDDIQAVIEVMHSDWLTGGPIVDEFQQAFADLVGTKYAVAVSNGTAALHAAMHAIGIEPGDEVIVPAMTFVATANCVVFQGGTPVFVDVDPETLLIDPEQVEAKITPHTKAVIAVDYTGNPCDYDALREVADRHGLTLVADACHALGGTYKGRPVGSLADLSVFSFHPVKHITTGEGGMITTDDRPIGPNGCGFSATTASPATIASASNKAPGFTRWWIWATITV